MSLATRVQKLLTIKPRKYQNKGIAFLEKRRGRAILGDEMGLGKTLQAIAWLALHPELRPVLIVCPSSLKWQWRRFLRRHAKLDAAVLEGHKDRQLPKRDIWIANYEIIWRWRGLIRHIGKPKVLILDECHHIKTVGTQRTQACARIGKDVKHIIAISGTPIEQCPIEFWPVLHLIDPKQFGSFWKYAFRYCAPKRGFRGRGWDFRGSDNLDELRYKVSRIMIRRLKKDVLSELPSKIYSEIPVSISNRAEYNTARDEFLLWYAQRQGVKRAARIARKGRGVHELLRIGALQRICAMGKVKTAVEWIKDFLHKTDEKLLIFVRHHDVVNALRKKLPKNMAVITGKTPTRKRRDEERRFQSNPECRIFLGTIKAAGEGLNLTAGSSVLFLEYWWNPSAHKQAVDRVHRIGQKARAINVFQMVGRHTVDAQIFELLRDKQQVVNQVLDGRSNDVEMVGGIVEGLIKEKKLWG